VNAVQAPREVQAQAKWVRSSARKARLVTDQIRGRPVPEARTILAFSQRAIAREVEKVLNSAVANAESRPDLLLNGDELIVAAAYADEGPTMKRWRARARGRVARIRKRTCHITVRLAEVPQDGLTGKRPAQREAEADTAGASQAEAPTGEPGADTAAAERPVRAERGPGEGARGNREVSSTPTETAESEE
jgi:large subunit ribosomal protein L22